MGWYAADQGLHGVNANGAVDFQLDWSAVSAPLPIDLAGQLTNVCRFTWGIEMTCETFLLCTIQKSSAEY